MIDKLQKLRKIKRHELHELVNEIHREHKISKKTLFYVKEYGSHSNIPLVIIKESTKILLVSAVIASFGGITLEYFKQNLEKLAPLIIVVPALNDMIGDFGTTFSGKISTMLHEGKIRNNILQNYEIKALLVHSLIIAFIGGLLISGGAVILKGHGMQIFEVIKFVFIVLVDVLFLVIFMFVISTKFGKYFFKNKEDPNNFLIPISTSIADLANILIISFLVAILI